MRLKLSHFMIVSLCLSLTVTGCSLQDLLGNKKKSSSQSAQKSEPVVAVSLSADDPNQILLQKGIDDMAGKENVKIKYLNNPSTGDAGQSQSSSSSGSKQSSGQAGGGQDPLKDVKVLIYQGGDLGLLQTAQTKKVPILALGQVPAGSKPLGLITPNQENIGELMGQALTSKIQAGTVVLIQDDPGATGAQERLAGIRAALSKYPKLSLQVISGHPGSESAATIAFLEYLQKNPGKVQGVLADTERAAAQAAQVLKQGQLEKKVLLFGGQANIQSLQRMAGGVQAGDVDVSPYLQGVNAFQWAEKVIKKEPFDINDSVTGDQGEIPAKVITVKAVTPENLAITQKSYVKAVSLAQQAQKQQAQKQQASANSSAGSQGQEKKKQDSQSSAGSSGSGSQASSSNGGQPGGQSGGNFLPGVAKVTERVNTEITREYLDSKGKVLWTEKSSNQQVRTVPPEMLKQEQGQQQQKQQSGGQQKSGQQGGDQSSGGGDGGQSSS